MHLLPTISRTLDEASAAIDLDQSPADVVALSFTDNDLALLAAAYRPGLPDLRLASLSQLKHPYSVDLYLEKTCAGARFVLVRLLGGMDYWRYGVEQLASLARARGFALAIIPGDHREDGRMDEASTLDLPELRAIWRYFQEGGADNAGALLKRIARHIGRPETFAEPAPVPAFGLFDAACGLSDAECSRGEVAGKALIVFYRAALMAADVRPVEALALACRERGLMVTCVHVTSLKDPAAANPLADWIAAHKPDIILNTTAFSGQSGAGGTVLDGADAPVLQVMLGGSSREIWAADSRGLGAADLAMNVVLPELDGRLVTRAISFKALAVHSEALQFAGSFHQPDASRVDFVARLASAWVRLRKLPNAEKKTACILSDYPARGGRGGYAVGLDTPASVAVLAAAMRAAGHHVGPLPRTERLMQMLTEGGMPAQGELQAQGQPHGSVTLAEYRGWLAQLPEAFRQGVNQAWGDPALDPGLRDGRFGFRHIAAGNFLLALQPPRGRLQGVRADYHDGALAPCHGYIAFYLWLRHRFGMDAMIHLGTHGTLEWLPGKAVALSHTCAPEVLLGPVPVIYPFIVNNPGEAAQARRRLAAIALGHLTPTLMDAGQHGAGQELETLLDEYASAASLDPRRARQLAAAIVERALASGLAADAGIAAAMPPEQVLQRLDAFLCDCKEMRIGDGLHIFGAAGGPDATDMDRACAQAETANLLGALSGRFVPPGPGGAPSQGRTDVLPTGRNLYSVDPRQVPTRTAYDIGTRIAAEIMDRHAQDHGEWPRTIVMDLWGSATMRTGGDEIAQALALMGVRPVWDAPTGRVLGFEIIPQARLERPRVDVTLRISGLFRDVFATQIVLLDAAVQAVAALEEEGDFNPLAAARAAAPARIFGAAPGAYGIGLGDRLADADWQQEELGAAYLAATSHAYGGAQGAGTAEPEAFAERVKSADAFVHGQDMAGQDILDSAAFAEHEGGFAAAARLLGCTPALYHADSTRRDRPKIRTLREEVARVVRARAGNPRWIEGQMRHGYRGAGELAETVDNLFAYAALADVVESHHFELMFDAYCDDDRVRAFLLAANPAAAQAIAGRLQEAQRRGFWQTSRNSVAARLAEMRSAA